MKTLICDDLKIVRAGIKQLLQECPDIKYIKEADDGEEALSILECEDIDIVLLNISLPGISGLELLDIIKKRWKAIKVLILSNKTREQDAIRAFRYGASGYLATDSDLQELFAAVKKIAHGGKYISTTLAEKIAVYVENNKDIPKHNLLSSREYATMVKLAMGKPLREIGDELFISIKTVSTYRTRLLKKMNLSKNFELTKYCLENQLI